MCCRAPTHEPHYKRSPHARRHGGGHGNVVKSKSEDYMINCMKKMFFFRSTGPILINLCTKHPYVQFCPVELKAGHILLPG